MSTDGDCSTGPLAGPTPSIDIWTCLLDPCHVGVDAWAQDLDDDERSTAARLSTRSLSVRFVARHAMVRHVLASYLNQQPATLRFRRGPHGKPALRRDSSDPVPFFNLSHSGDLIVVAVTWSGEIGVDVEEIKPFEENVAALFSLREQQQLAALVGHRALLAFYRYWTSKEAVVKLLGTGLSTPADHVEISDPNGALSLISIQGDPALASNMHLHPFEIPGFIGAIATRSSLSSLTFKTWNGP